MAATSTDAARDKRALRTEVVARRRAVPERLARAAARSVAAHLAAQPAWRHCRRVGLYAALPDELPSQPLAELGLRAGKVLLWPRLTGPTLEFAPARVEDLVPGRYGVRAPPAQAPAVVLGEGDLLLIPGVAFDARGRRLGRGGGHYDRLLAARRGALAVGVGYAFQCVARVPAEAHDQPVHAWLSEAGFVWIEGEEA